MRAEPAEDLGEHQPPIISAQLAALLEDQERTRAEVCWLMVDDDAPTLRDLFSRPAWMDRGACCDVPTPAFFIERGGDQAPARRACAVCVVRSECLAYAMADPELKGYWGGTSERQRRQMRSGAA